MAQTPPHLIAQTPDVLRVRSARRAAGPSVGYSGAARALPKRGAAQGAQVAAWTPWGCVGHGSPTDGSVACGLFRQAHRGAAGPRAVALLSDPVPDPAGPWVCVRMSQGVNPQSRPLPRWPSCCSQRVTLAPAPTWPWDVHLRPGTRIPPPLPHRYRAFALAEGAGSRAGAQRGSEGLSGAVSHLFACWPRRSLFTQGSMNADRPVGHASYLPAGTFPTRRLLLRLGSVSSPGIPSFPASSLGERSR